MALLTSSRKKTERQGKAMVTKLYKRCKRQRHSECPGKHQEWSVCTCECHAHSAVGGRRPAVKAKAKAQATEAKVKGPRNPFGGLKVTGLGAMCRADGRIKNGATVSELAYRHGDHCRATCQCRRTYTVTILKQGVKYPADWSKRFPPVESRKELAS